MKNRDSNKKNNCRIYKQKKPATVSGNLSTPSLWDVKPRDVKLEESSKLTARDSPEETVKRETPTLQKPLPRSSAFLPRPNHFNLRINCPLGMFQQVMARRELISNKIERFDNRPENYTNWRAAFKNMTRQDSRRGTGTHDRIHNWLVEKASSEVTQCVCRKSS